MPAPENTTHGETRPRPYPPADGVPLSVRDLLAANAAARLVSTPPRAPEPRPVTEPRPEAA
ncbi:hypothetical protein ACFYZU_15695 [Streptomyces sp. NPDC001651]|jgi:hypothetical protein|uniref:hypothetical protein n=1 Tax=unclassified Streptomyces TaxID=2593676 RepID=UPI00368E24A6